MTSRFVMVCALLAAIAVPAGMARADWPADKKKAFTADCLSSCLENPKVATGRKGGCSNYCSCVLTDALREFSEADYAQLERDFDAEKKTSATEKFRAIFPVCNKRAWGP